MLRRSLFSFFSAVLFAACSSTEKSSGSLLSSDVPATTYKIEGRSQEVFRWNERGRAEEIIPLETSSASIIADPDKVIVEGGNFYILDTRNYKLVVFGKDGKFVQKIGGIGKGPGEYKEIRDFDINGNYIYTLDYKKVHQYDVASGRFIKTIHLDLDGSPGLNPMHFAVLGENHYYLWASNPDVYKTKDKSFFQLFEYKNDRIVGDYFEHKYKMMDGNRFNKSFAGGYYLTPRDGDYCIYKIEDKKITNEFKLDFGSDSLPADFYKEKHGGEYFNILLRNKYYKLIDQIRELPKGKLYFSCIGPGSYTYEGLIDKKTGQVYFGKQDFKYSPVIVYSDSKYVYGYYKPHRIINRLNESDSKNEIFESLKKRTGNISDMDNIIFTKIAVQ